MRRVIETEESEGFEAMLGELITVWCGIYIYSGRLTGVADDHLELDEAVIVYETGPLDEPGWKDAQKLPGKHRVMKQGIESWGPVL